MADISTELQAIREAVYGEQVRGAIVDALESINENAEAAEAWATGGSGGTAGAQNNAKYYAEQAAESAATFEVDETLSVAGKAADAAVVGDAVTSINNQISTFLSGTEFDFSSVSTTGWSINSAGNWTYAVTKQQSYLLPLTGIKRVNITAGEETSIFAFLNTNNAELGEAADFSPGFTTRVTLSANNTKEYAILDGMNYLFILKKDTSGVERTPTLIVFEMETTVDNTLTISGKAADAKVTGDKLLNMRDILYSYNSVDVLFIEHNTRGSSTSAEVTYTCNDDGSWTITGTATGNVSVKNVLGSVSYLVPSLKAGRTYYLDLHGGSIPIQFFVYAPTGDYSYTVTANRSITIPANATAFLARLRIPEGVTVNETINYTMVTEVERAVNGGGGGGGSYVINNTYTITTNPTITTDSNGWLMPIDESLGDDDSSATDMTGAIMSMLTDTGYCHLAPGVFYVSGNIDMPEKTVLCGCGDKTELRLLSSVNAGYIVKAQKFCTIKDVAFSGSYSSISPSIDGHRDAIHFTANYDGSEGQTESTTNHCMISNVWIRKFSGSGIYCHNSGISTSKGLYVCNAYISSCYVGVNIDYYSEFGKYTNICTASCYYGVVNNGGNNVFSACTFHATSVGFYIDGSKPNAAHGTINGCTFCHVGSNNGIAFKAKDITAGFIVANSQIWYNSVELTNCQGVLFDGCEFGRGITDDGAVSASVVVTGGNLVLLSGCMFHLDTTRPPKFTITGDAKVVLSGCYGTQSGNPITLNS